MLKLFLSLFIFAKFGYVVELDSTYEVYYQSGISERIEYLRYKILSDQVPEELRSLTISYTPYYNTADFEYVRIIRGKDTLYLDTKNIVDVLAPPDLGGTIFWGEREKILEVKDLRKGDILESKVRKYGGNWLGPTGSEKYKTPYPGYFNQIMLFGSSVPIKKKVYVLEELKEKPVKYGIFNGKIKHRILNRDGKRLHVFYLKNIKPYKSEPFSPSQYDFLPKLILTNIPSWREMSRIEFQRAEPNVTPDEMVKSFADSLCQGITDENEKIKKLFYFVADEIRYLGLIESEMEGYEPHPASLTLKKRSGVCKDKAALLVALLRAQGFKAYYATTAAGMRMENIPADQANHAIVALEKGNDYEYLDPTIGAGGRDLMPASEGGQSVLVSREEGDTLRTIPLSSSASNKVSIFLFTDMKGDTVYFNYLMKFNGGFDQQFRRIAQGGRKGIERFVRNSLSNVYTGTLVIDSLSFTEPQDYSDYFKVQIFGKVLNKIVKTPDFKLYKPVSFKIGKSFVYFLESLTSERKLDFKIRFPQSVEVTEYIPYSKVEEPFVKRQILGKENSYRFEFVSQKADERATKELKNIAGNNGVQEWYLLSTILRFDKRQYSPDEVRSMYRDYRDFQENESLWLILKGE